MFLIILFGVLIICINVILQSVITVFSLKYLHQFNSKKGEISIKAVLFQTSLSVSLLTLLHGAQCTIWAATFYFNPNIDNLYSFKEAIYFSLITFTTVGYGDVVINGDWKILAGLEAINGIMMVGWSTALMFSYFQIILKKNISK
ncbi:potassium channel family protein [Algoriella sp.]|uniref:potassium channel family protein n=1 Tax=Algoriella sp. TaxID=1872434 RepID=UPI002FC6E701